MHLLATLSRVVVYHANHKGKENELAVRLNYLGWESLHESDQNLKELQSSALAAITEVLQKEINVALKSFIFQGVVKQELDEDGLA